MWKVAYVDFAWTDSLIIQLLFSLEFSSSRDTAHYRQLFNVDHTLRKWIPNEASNSEQEQKRIENWIPLAT